MNIELKRVEKQLEKDNIPVCHPGDTVEVKVQIEEGGKVRSQLYKGVVLKVRNRGISSSITIRKISNGVGVERTFVVHSPLVQSIDIVRRGKVRQAKLYYLRGLTAKKARIPEKRQASAKKKAKPVVKKETDS